MVKSPDKHLYLKKKNKTRGLNQATSQICNFTFLLPKNYINNDVKWKIILKKKKKLMFSRRYHTLLAFFFNSSGKEVFV